MPGTTTAEVVDTVLETLRKAAETGDTSAVDDLRKRSAEGGKATAPAASKASTPDKLTLPDTEVIRPNGEAYICRKIDGHHDVALLRKCRQTNTPVLLYGAPGTGKTALIEAAYVDPATLAASAEAAALATLGAYKVYTIQGSGDTETADFVGGWVQVVDSITGVTRYEWVDGPLLKAMKEGAVLYIDEIALIDPKVMAIVYGVMDGRDELRITANPELGVVHAEPGFYVAAACNPNAPGARMSEALLSRFSVQVEVTTDYALAKRMGVNNDAVKTANNLATKLAEGQISWAPQLRELLDFKKVEEMLGTETACRNLISTAPEMDRPKVKDVVSRTFAKELTALKIS